MQQNNINNSSEICNVFSVELNQQDNINPLEKISNDNNLLQQQDYQIQCSLKKKS